MTNEQQNDHSNSKEALTEEIKENIMVEGPKVNSPLSNTDHKPNLLSMTALRERRKISLSIESKSNSTIESDNGVARHGLISGGCSSRESTTSGRSSTTPTQSLLTPPATSPTTPQVCNGHLCARRFLCGWLKYEFPHLAKPCRNSP